MWCYCCKQKFYNKRTFLTLFETKNKYICDKCYDANPINLQIHSVPLDDGDITIISLFDSNYKVDMLPYSLEINQIFSHFYHKFKGYKIILLDQLDLSFLNLEVLSFWSTVFDKKVLIICGILRK